MKTNIMRKGFTLIELLVVITIIGILATGGISVYTTQIQKARDSSRITDMKTIQGAIEQSYQDNSVYLSALKFSAGVIDYIGSIPGDPKTGDKCNDGGNNSNTLCGYTYKAGDDNNGTTLGEFEMSIAFENSTNLTKLAETDEGNNSYRYELGIDLSTTDTSYTNSIPILAKKGICTTASAPVTPTNTTDIIVINKSGICN